MVSIVWFVKMFTSSKKISKDKGAEPTEFEESVAQVSYNAFVRHIMAVVFRILMS